MGNVLAIAKKLNELHQNDHNGKRMDKMRMHKLLYFLQREALIKNINQPLFEDDFEGWKWGPVIPAIHEELKKAEPFDKVTQKVSRAELNLIKKVYFMYLDIPSWDLNLQTQQDFSWKYARVGKEDGESSNKIIPLNAIKVDAIKERMNRKEQGMLS